MSDKKSISALLKIVQEKGKVVEKPTKTLVKELLSKSQVLVVCLTPGSELSDSESEKKEPDTIYWVQNMAGWSNHQQTTFRRSFNADNGNFTKSFYLIDKKELPDEISKAPAPTPRSQKTEPAQMQY